MPGLQSLSRATGAVVQHARSGPEHLAETPEPTRSASHVWSASPNFDLLTIVAGIRPGSRGFKTVRIEPHLEGLHQLNASMPHPSGMIETSYHLEGPRWTATITLPSGVDCQFAGRDNVLPLHSGTQTLSLPGQEKPQARHNCH